MQNSLVDLHGIVSPKRRFKKIEGQFFDQNTRSLYVPQCKMSLSPLEKQAENGFNTKLATSLLRGFRKRRCDLFFKYGCPVRC